jgi:hypothetical protein
VERPVCPRRSGFLGRPSPSRSGFGPSAARPRAGGRRRLTWQMKAADERPACHRFACRDRCGYGRLLIVLHIQTGPVQAVDYGFHVTALRMIGQKVLECNVAGIRAYTRELIMDAVKEDFPDPFAVRGITTED